MSNISAADIRAHVIDPATENDFDEATRDRMEDAILEAAPLDTWTLDGTDYTSSALTIEEFWAIIEKVGTTA